MFIPKKYGHSKIDNCPFCGKHATLMNKQSVPVCISHKEDLLDDLKCFCGEPLEMLHGKFGVFFSCRSCGNMNLRKVMEFNQIAPKPKQNREFMPSRTNEYRVKTTTTVRSDDPRYFD